MTELTLTDADREKMRVDAHFDPIREQLRQHAKDLRAAADRINAYLSSPAQCQEDTARKLWLTAAPVPCAAQSEVEPSALKSDGTKLAARVYDYGTYVLSEASGVPCAASPADALIDALRELTEACEADLTSVDTDIFGDDESVGGGMEGDCAVTFGMIRRARAVLNLATLRATGEGAAVCCCYVETSLRCPVHEPDAPPVAEGARDARHEDRGVGGEGGQPDDRATVDGSGVDGASGEARSSADLRGASVRSTAADEPATPVAVSLDPHRLRIVRQIEVRLRDMLFNHEAQLRAAHELAKSLLPADNSDLPTTEELSGIWRDEKDAELARLRGEATVRE